jgi:hypothetical protein
VPIAWVVDALQRLLDGEEVEVSVPSLGYRSAFVGAVLLAVPGAALVGSAPPRVRLSAGGGDEYRLAESARSTAGGTAMRRSGTGWRSPIARISVSI